MTKRKLRPSIERILTIVTTLIFVMFGMLNDYDLKATPIIMLLMFLALMNIHLLSKYGTGIFNDRD